MGFFGKPDPIELLKKELENKPNDSKLLLDLAGQLKAKNRIEESVEHYQRAAQALADAGFAPKAVAILKQVTQMAPKAIEPYEKLAAFFDEMNVKEDLRPVLKTMLTLYRNNGNETQAKATEKRIEALGPGR